MSTTHLTRIAMAIAVLTLAACSSTKLAETGDVSGKAVVAAPASPAPAPAPAKSAVAAVVADHLNPSSLISKERSVYFDFDQFVIKASDGPLIERQGKYLASKPTLAIRVEGNADERGGREYNLALGQKRAEAVRRSMTLLGVAESQIEAVSLGEEKPAQTGSTEESYARNRRAEVNYR